MAVKQLKENFKKRLKLKTKRVFLLSESSEGEVGQIFHLSDKGAM